MATASGAAVVGLFIDGTLLRTATAAPYVFPTPTSLPFGTHDIAVVAQDAQNHQAREEHIATPASGAGVAQPLAGAITSSARSCAAWPRPSSRSSA